MSQVTRFKHSAKSKRVELIFLSPRTAGILLKMPAVENRIYRNTEQSITRND